MKFLINFIVIFFFFQSFLLAKIENKIIVKVENQIITNYEIKNKILTTLILNKKEISQQNIDLFKKEVLETLIQLKLKKIELSKYDIKKNDRQIQMYLQSISSNDVMNLKKTFEENDLNYELFLSDIAIELMWQELIYRIYKNKIQISENVINEELKKIVNINSASKEYNLSEIEIFINDFQNEKEKIKILNIQNILLNEKFELVAKKFSDSMTASQGGKLGWINEEALSKDILNSIKNLKIGEISKPIEKQDSILFIKVNEIKQKTNNIENETDLRKKIINRKKNQLFNLYSQSHLSKLKNNSLIEYK